MPKDFQLDDFTFLPPPAPPTSGFVHQCGMEAESVGVDEITHGAFFVQSGKSRGARTEHQEMQTFNGGQKRAGSE